MSSVKEKEKCVSERDGEKWRVAVSARPGDGDGR